MADLIINDVIYQRVSYDSLGGGSWLYRFKLNINNIGDRTTNDSFFISNTRTVLDYYDQYFTHGRLFNSNHQSINPEQSLIDIILCSIPIESNYVLFKISALGDTTLIGEELPYADESNYENNYYTLEIAND